MSLNKKNYPPSQEKKGHLSFEEKMERLEHICERLRSPETKLEEASMLFKEGITLSKTLEKELSDIERKVEILGDTQTIEPSDSSDQSAASSDQSAVESYADLFSHAKETLSEKEE